MERQEKVSILFKPNSSTHTSYFRAIQGHSGGIAIDVELQDNVLLRKGFTEYIYHVGNDSESALNN